VDPDVAALKQRVAQLTDHLTAQEQQRNSIINSSAASSARQDVCDDQFASEKDASGQPLGLISKR